MTKKKTVITKGRISMEINNSYMVYAKISKNMHDKITKYVE